MRKIYLLLILMTGISKIWSQTTPIPDQAFEQVLIDNGWDDVIDGQVLLSNISGVTSLILDSKNITDLTGVKEFANLQALHCSYNPGLTTIDVSGLSSLRTIYAFSCGLTSLVVNGAVNLENISFTNNQVAALDLTGLTKLKMIQAGKNKLVSLDVSGAVDFEWLECGDNLLELLNVSGLTKMTHFGCRNNKLSSLDMAGKSLLESFDCSVNEIEALDLGDLSNLVLFNCRNNKISSLDMGNVINLNTLTCSRNQLTGMLDLTAATQLTGVDCSFNGLTALNVQGLNSLEYIETRYNALATLDVSGLAALKEVYCGNNQLTNLNISNTVLETLDCYSNAFVTIDLTSLPDSASLSIFQNSALNCLQVNDVDVAQNNPNWYKDQNGIYALDCGGFTLIPDPVFEQHLITNGWDDVIDGKVLRANIMGVTSLNLYNKGITSLEGIQDFISLIALDCARNNLTTLSLAGLSDLNMVQCEQNQLTALDLSGAVSLNYLDCFQNQLAELNCSGLVNLEHLDARNNRLKFLDLSDSSILRVLYVRYNQLLLLDVTGLPALTYFDCRNNTSLGCVKVNNVSAAIAKANWSEPNNSVYKLNCDCTITTTWNGTVWSPFAPMHNQKAIIAANYNSTADLEVCSLAVNGNAVTTISSGNNLTVGGNVSVAASAQLVFEDGANLLQDPLATINGNTGSITYNKNSSALYNLDYTIWSSPTSGTQTLKEFSPFTLDASFFVYNTGLNAYSNYLSQSGIFGGNPNAVTFAQGKGYLIRMPAGLPADVTAVYNGQFKGKPNNGNISVALSTDGNRFNAVGNPYPSPINIHEFINANNSQLDNGTLYFWRKKNMAPTTTYATITKLAYVATDEATNIGTTFTGDPADWVINPGQGFLVKASSTATNLLFNNRMRVGVSNGQFFRPSNQSLQALSTTSPTEMSRIWLNINSNNANFGQTVIGYTNQTTNGLDFGWDGRLYNDADLSIYTKAEDSKLAIQARAVFAESDVVPLAYKANNGGTFTISISDYDGVFQQGQEIYLKDNTFNIWHNLKEGVYTFSSEAGTFENRFEVLYQDQALGTNDPVFNSNNIIVYKQRNTLNIDTGKAAMKEVIIYDVRGRVVYSNTAIDASKFAISSLMVEQQVLIVQMTMADQTRVSKKIIF